MLGYIYTSRSGIDRTDHPETHDQFLPYKSESRMHAHSLTLGYIDLAIDNIMLEKRVEFDQ